MEISDKDIHTHVVLVAGFVQKGNKFLVARRDPKDNQSAGKWSVPGGKVDLELGENVVQRTLKRELKEEVGVEIADDIVLIGNDSFIRSSGHHVIGLIFLCKWKSGIAKPLEDHDKITWLTLQELTNFQEADEYFKNRINYLLKYLRG